MTPIVFNTGKLIWESNTIGVPAGFAHVGIEARQIGSHKTVTLWLRKNIHEVWPVGLNWSGIPDSIEALVADVPNMIASYLEHKKLTDYNTLRSS